MKHYDVVIAGTGVAGLYASLHFEPHVKVLLLAKRDLTLSNSSLAQGGVAAVIDKTNDDYKLHIADTLIAGGYKNNLEALEVLVTEGPEDVSKIIEMGVDFDEDKSGNLQLAIEGGHSRRRVLHHKDSTGHEIVNKLLAKVLERPNIEIMTFSQLCSMSYADNGVYCTILQEGEQHIIATRYVILASGGIGRVYKNTTNSAIATGDGIAIAYELGARIKNLHLIQFHPTAFAAKGERERFLISEAVRGEGALLLNCHGERFMLRYDERGELAPRDKVSYSIMQEAKRTNSDKFYLDIRAKDPEYIKNRFPMIYERCLAEGVDITKDLIPIFPCQHYLMGGIDTDLHARTTLPRIYAAGECAHTGVHGLNRLASNSLLEALVFSRRAAEDISNHLEEEKGDISGTPPKPNTSTKPIPTGIRTKIREIMQKSYFIIPDIEEAKRGLPVIEDFLNMLKNGDYALTSDYVEAKSLATVAYIILKEITKS